MLLVFTKDYKTIEEIVKNVVMREFRLSGGSTSTFMSKQKEKMKPIHTKNEAESMQPTK
jgi:hypothetical protein